MNYEEAMAFLEDTKKYGCQPGLTSIRNLMGELGNVQELVPVVHIAGTNGKGSVGAMLSAVFAEAGYRVGRFNTPDVFSYEEEFLMNGLPIARERLAGLFTEVSAACARLIGRGLPHPTRFEVETAAAYLWFYEEKCDIALVEVGMGGAEDATNLIARPLVSVLTSISMDHMKFLGNTLVEIAAAKAGIIKPGCPVVSMTQEPEVLAVIQKKAREMKAGLVVADVSEAEDVRMSINGTSFYIRKGFLELSLPGTYQVANAVCALRVLSVLKSGFPGITENAVLTGLRNVRWPGRLELLRAANPAVVLDGAHNEDAARKLRESLDRLFPDQKTVYIMAVLADKDYEKMISIMFHPGDAVFTLTPPNPRALSAVELAAKLRERKIRAVACETPEDALRYARLKCAGREINAQTAHTDMEMNAQTDGADVIVVFGSLSYLGEMRVAVEKAWRDG